MFFSHQQFSEGFPPPPGLFDLLTLRQALQGPVELLQRYGLSPEVPHGERILVSLRLSASLVLCVLEALLSFRGIEPEPS